MADDGQSLREIGSARMREGRFAEAADSLTQAVAQNPDDEAAWRLLGGARASQGDADGAIEAFAQAANLRPDTAKNHYNLGLALQRVGRSAEARERFEQALSLDPGYDQARARLSEMAPVAPAPPPAPPAAEPEPPAPAPETASFGTSRVPRPPQMSSFERPRPAEARDEPTPPVAPAPMMGQQFQPREWSRPPVDGATIQTLGIVGLLGTIFCQIASPAAPIAWWMGNKALKTLEDHPNADPGLRSQVMSGRTMGMIGTILMALGVLLFLLMMLLGGMPN